MKRGHAVALGGIDVGPVPEEGPDRLDVASHGRVRYRRFYRRCGEEKREPQRAESAHA